MTPCVVLNLGLYFPPLLPPPEVPPDVFFPDPMDGTQLTDAFLDRLGFA